MQQKKQQQPLRGRPSLGSYRLQAVLPDVVVKMLIRREQETGLYRTRIATNVLCDWAEKQRGQ